MNNDKKKMTAKKYLERNTERELIRQYQLTGKSEYIEQLLFAHAAYIQKIAAEQYQKFGKLVEYEDLIQEGRVGLIKAVKKFKLDRTSVNPNTNTIVANQALLTYAHSYILSEMQSLSHRSNATHIPAHTLRAIQFDVKNAGCNTEERKKLAKKAMKAESLDWHFNANEDRSDNYERGTLQRITDNGEADPTFDQSITHIFSPENQQAIAKLSDKEWTIVQMRLGLVTGEEGILAKSSFIAEELGLPLDEVEKTFKRAKRILSKNLVK
jgi:RNA polymerase sigma factor (sigma-70 family)